MKRHESAGDFLVRHGKPYSDAGQFNVYKADEFCRPVTLPPNRRDFYKISLMVHCEGILSYADKVVHVRDNALSFANPMIPYAWQAISPRQNGYFCLFTEDFVTSQLKNESLADSPLFKVHGSPVLFPDQRTMQLLIGVFEQMLAEMQSPYKNKYDLLRSYVQIVMHEAMKMEPPEMHYKPGSSSSRISELFLELLERQFPVASPQHVIRLKNAGEFASQLAVHTNHLNRSLKEITGKTTSGHIADRVTKEAKALLLHSNWDIAEIGNSLGFEHPSNFNIFFKKQTGQTPLHFRRSAMTGV